jgi:hypothetical protein
MKARYVVRQTALTRLIAILPDVRDSDVLTDDQLQSLAKALDLENLDD